MFMSIAIVPGVNAGRRLKSVLAPHALCFDCRSCVNGKLFLQRSRQQPFDPSLKLDHVGLAMASQT